jgi:hypothetical protein
VAICNRGVCDESEGAHFDDLERFARVERLQAAVGVFVPKDADALSHVYVVIAEIVAHFVLLSEGLDSLVCKYDNNARGCQVLVGNPGAGEE